MKKCYKPHNSDGGMIHESVEGMRGQYMNVMLAATSLNACKVY